MIVMEFDEASTGSRDALLNLASAVRGEVHRNPLIIVSAAPGVASWLQHAARSAAIRKAFEPAWSQVLACQAALIEDLGLPSDLLRDEFQAIHALLREIAAASRVSPRTLDLVASYGERMAVRVVAEFLTLVGLRATPRMAWDMGLQTDSCFGSARPTRDSTRMMRAAWAEADSGVVVINGCSGKDKSGAVTRLGPEGGDLSAALFGAALQAEEIQVWTSASHGMNLARRLVKAARVQSGLLLAERAERGCSVPWDLDADIVEPSHRTTIPVRVMDTATPEGTGTLITPPGVTNVGVRGEARIPLVAPGPPPRWPDPASPRFVRQSAGLAHAGPMAR